MLNLEKLSNPMVRIAIQAFQAGDKTAWLAAFSATATLSDDGTPRSFGAFTDDALGHERFISIDRIEPNGLHVFGTFHSDQWGEFNTYFKFTLGGDGKFVHLDIGQSD